MFRIHIRVLGLLFISVAGVKADYSPLAVGNEWIFSGETNSMSGRGDFRESEFKERLSMRVTEKSVRRDSVFWTVRVQNAITDYVTYDASNVGQGEPTSYPDTVLGSNWVFLELKGDIRKVSGNLRLPAETEESRITRHLNHNFFLSREPLLFGDPISGTNSGYLAIHYHNLPSPTQAFGGSKQGWYVKDVGPYWLRYGGVGDCGDRINRELKLITFNGKAINLGVSPPESPLQKEARRTCSIRKEVGMQGFSHPKAVGGSPVFDIIGRAKSILER